MDVCLMKPGKYNVVEFNGLISSSFYSADVGRVVEAIERMMLMLELNGPEWRISPAAGCRLPGHLRSLVEETVSRCDHTRVSHTFDGKGLHWLECDGRYCSIYV
jgi:hypothetical protein